MRRALALLVVCLPLPMARAEGPPPDLAARAWAVADVVVDRHLEPPARQQMLLAGVRAMLDSAKAEPPIGLARRVSGIVTPEAFAALLSEVWPRSAPADHDESWPDDVLMAGMFAIVPGGGMVVPAKEAKVSEQMAGNVYVGIQVALGYEATTKMTTFEQILPGGPAEKVGIKAGDRIEAIDGVSVVGVPLAKVVDRLRGEEGTRVAVRVRREGQADPITFAMVRGRLPRKTMNSVPAGPRAVGCIKIKEIVGSSVQELKALARKLEADGARGLILDLRGVNGDDLHPAVMLADALLEGGTIGRVRTADGVVVYQAEPDAVFREGPMAVVVDETTMGVAAWLAMALRDNRQASVVGTLSGGDDQVTTLVPIFGGAWSVRMVTGRLEGKDGRLMVAKAAPAAPMDLSLNRYAPVIKARPKNQVDYAALEGDAAIGTARPALGPDPIVEAGRIVEGLLNAKTP